MRTEKVEMLRITRKRNLEYLNNLLSFKMSEIYDTHPDQSFIFIVKKSLCIAMILMGAYYHFVAAPGVILYIQTIPNKHCKENISSRVKLQLQRHSPSTPSYPKFTCTFHRVD